LLHLDTLIKIDLIMAKQTPFDTALRQQVVSYQLDDSSAPVRVASVVEMLPVKLRRYSQDARSRTDGMKDDAEWNDILGMLEVQGPVLEREMLEMWARALKVTETLRRALVDAGIEWEEGGREQGDGSWLEGAPAGSAPNCPIVE
jgi:hypothetical protein